MFIPPRNVKKKFGPTKFWQIFKLRPSIIMGGSRNYGHSGKSLNIVIFGNLSRCHEDMKAI